MYLYNWLKATSSCNCLSKDWGVAVIVLPSDLQKSFGKVTGSNWS